MFDKHESLKCISCRSDFVGRKPAEGGAAICPSCLAASELPVIEEGEPVPMSVAEEFEFGGGENE